MVSVPRWRLSIGHELSTWAVSTDSVNLKNIIGILYRRLQPLKGIRSPALRACALPHSPHVWRFEKRNIASLPPTEQSRLTQNINHLYASTPAACSVFFYPKSLQIKSKSLINSLTSLAHKSISFGPYFVENIIWRYINHSFVMISQYF